MSIDSWCHPTISSSVTPFSSISRVYTTGIWRQGVSKGYLYTHVIVALVITAKKLRDDEWINKTRSFHKWNITQVKKKWSFDTCHNMDGTWKHYAKWNQPIIKSQILYDPTYVKGFPGGSDGKEFTRNAGDSGLILGLGRSSGGGNGNPLQYSSPNNPLDRRRRNV